MKFFYMSCKVLLVRILLFAKGERTLELFASFTVVGNCIYTIGLLHAALKLSVWNLNKFQLYINDDYQDLLILLFASYCTLGIIGVGITLISNPYAIIFGRLVAGYSGGLSCVYVPRYIEETVPHHLMSLFGSVFASMQGLGSFASLMIGIILPPDDDP